LRFRTRVDEDLLMTPVRRETLIVGGMMFCMSSTKIENTFLICAPSRAWSSSLSRRVSPTASRMSSDT
ncbi:MAG: hypothetical protein VX053_04835, partial [Pseudomonadota bacterium]|nr:hypothetical protein [Pseudomonadota bacterium]